MAEAILESNQNPEDGKAEREEIWLLTITPEFLN